MARTLLILASLIVGLTLGMAMGDDAAGAQEAAEIVGAIWLNALRMTVLPLAVALLITGVVKTAQTASSGKLAARSIGWMLALLVLSTCIGALLVPALLRLFPVPEQASLALQAGLARAGHVAAPQLSDFFRSIVPTNIFAAAADDAMLPVILFSLLLAFALLRVPQHQRAPVTDFFEGLSAAIIVMIGWVLWLAPLGVFALAYGLGARSGAAAFGGLAHYVLILVTTGAIIWLGAVLLALVGAHVGPARFLRASIPAQAVALSTQSSLASLPAMLEGADALGVRRETADVVLPIAVTIFRVTSPAFNLGVALYVAAWAGIALTPWQIGIGVGVATLTTLGSVSLPGSVSFIGSIGPICLAMGLPIEPLGLLVAIESFPDLMRTLGNVTMDMALTATIDRREGGNAEVRLP